MTRQQKEKQLKNWNPHWSTETIKNWTDKQLNEIYKKEQRKTVDMIRLSLGLPA